MTRIIYVVYTKEYLTSRQIIGANLKKYAFLCDYSEVKIDDLIDSPMYSTPMQAVSISPCESLKVGDTILCFPDNEGVCVRDYLKHLHE